MTYAFNGHKHMVTQILSVLCVCMCARTWNICMCTNTHSYAHITHTHVCTCLESTEYYAVAYKLERPWRRGSGKSCVELSQSGWDPKETWDSAGSKVRDRLRTQAGLHLGQGVPSRVNYCVRKELARAQNQQANQRRERVKLTASLSMDIPLHWFLETFP